MIICFYFHRSSGQTWLQLQQQKLRAKRELQNIGDNDYFGRTTHIDIRNRPLRYVKEYL